MRNIALRLSYDGSQYHGWQIQKNEISVAETLDRALTKVCQHPVRTVGCGRTDAGVHALRYCANFRTDCRIPLDRLPFAVNARLPADIAVASAVEAPEGFNAIGSCIKKEYIYKLFNSPIRDPFLEKRACFYPQRLDLERMARAAAAFEGTHDFKAVRSVGPHGVLVPGAAGGADDHGLRLRGRFSLQHVPRHCGHARLRLLREAGAGGDPGAFGEGRPSAHRAHDAASGAVFEPGLVPGAGQRAF